MINKNCRVYVGIPAIRNKLCTDKANLLFKTKEIAAMRLKNAERKTKIKQLENQLEGCRKSKANSAWSRDHQEEEVEDDIRRMEPHSLGWLWALSVLPVAIGAMLVGCYDDGSPIFPYPV